MASKRFKKIDAATRASVEAWVKEQEDWFAANPDREFRRVLPSGRELEVLLFSGVILGVSAHAPNALPAGCQYIPSGGFGNSTHPPLLIVRRGTAGEPLSAILFPFFPKASIVDRGPVYEELLCERVWSKTLASLRPDQSVRKEPDQPVRKELAHALVAAFMPAPEENVH